MKNLIKKTLCCVLIFVLMSTFIVGCKKTSEEDLQTTQQATKQETTTGTNEKPTIVDIIQYIPGTEDGTMRDLDKVVAEANKILNKKLGINLIVKMFPDATYNEKMQMVINSGEPWDMCTTTYSQVDVITNVAQGAFKDITDLIEKYAPDVVKFFGIDVFKAYSIGGKIYTIPNIYEWSVAPQVCVQLPILDALKIPYKKAEVGDIVKGNYWITSGVTEFDDVIPILEKAKEFKDLYPLKFETLKLFTDLTNVEFYEDIAIITRDNPKKLVPITESQYYIEALDKIHDFYLKGYMRKDEASVSKEQASKDFEAGKYAVLLTYGSPSLPSTLYNTTKKEYATARIGPASFPTLMLRAAMTAISAKCKYPEKVLEFINFKATDAEIANLLKYGIKDVHYKLGNDKDMYPIEDSGYTAINYTGTMFAGLFVKGMGTEDGILVYCLPAKDFTKILEIEKAWDDSAVRSPITGFSPVLSTEIQGKLSAVKSVLKEYEKIYCTPPAQYETKKNEFFEKLKKAGINEVVAEYQKQLDEWLKARGK